MIRNIRQHTDLPLCIDSEGAQTRTDMFVGGAVHLRENRIISAHRKLVPGDTFVISKIECWNGIESLAGIMGNSNSVLIECGDLSREFPLKRIPDLQKMIISRTKKRGHRCMSRPTFWGR